MATTFTTSFDFIRKGDLNPPFTAQLFLGTDPYVITGEASVVLRMRNQSTGVSTDHDASVVNADTGNVSYTWQAGDTDVPGVYSVEFVVTDANGITSFPDSHVVKTFEITKF